MTRILFTPLSITYNGIADRRRGINNCNINIDWTIKIWASAQKSPHFDLLLFQIHNYTVEARPNDPCHFFTLGVFNQKYES